MFTDEQLEALSAPLAAERVKHRPGANNQKLSFLEGWDVIETANRILGPGCWSRETLSMEPIHEPKLVSEPDAPERNKVVAAYMARVRITVYSQDGTRSIVREAYGAARNFARTVGEACEMSAKSAETDATKRALATLGHPLGLALYDSQHRHVQALPQRNGDHQALDEGFDAPQPQRLTTSQRALAASRRNGRGDPTDLPV
jgi:DNA repair and recombination protein RAD52